MGNICFKKNIIDDATEIQSVIFTRQVILKNEILVWTEKRCRAWMLSRNWIFIEPPDCSVQDRIRMHVEKEDKFEGLDYQDMGNGITIVWGIIAPPEPRRRKLMVHTFSKKSNIHTLRG